MPETLNPVPLAVTAEMSTFDPPLFFSVSVWLELCPTTTLLKVKFVGLAASDGAVTAVPLKPKVKFGFDPSEVTTTLPLNVPDEAGANFTVNEVVCPAPSVTGENPETLNPVPLAATAETSTLVPPEFVRVSVCVWLWPTCTLVNEKLLGDGLIVPPTTPVPDSETSIG
jgi:hypothetical protein